MRGFSSVGVGEDEEQAGGKRENGVSWAGLLVSAQHKRSKSASDRNCNVLKGGFLSSTEDQNETDISLPSTSASKGQGSRHENCTYVNKNMSSKHRASLEKDIEQLQLRLQQEKSMRIILERTMGRASSTLSPGHRHFAAQTKELIAEIESLEEEVANREQRVLSLYRSVFEHSVSRPPSEQNSGVASPAHPKHEARKHPSIISSAFCSSKKFPFRPLQALVSVDDPGKRHTKTGHSQLSGGRAHIDSAKSCSGPPKLLAMEKTSILRTLRDHLHQCPSKLSEEMVRCMAVVYCWLRSAASVNTEKNRSPILSRSSTNIVKPRRGIGEDQDWSGESMVEILWISTDKSQFSRASYAINNYRVLVEQLERVNVGQMEDNARVSFWINVYNALVMHAYLAYGIPNSSLRRLALFHKAAYNIGGHVISANAIEQSIFCLRTPRIGWWLETILSAALRKKSCEDRRLSSTLGLPNSQPLVCFALCTGAFSDPALRVYTASNFREELEEAKRDFLQSNVVVKKSRKVFLPKTLERFARDASFGSDDLLKWVTENVDKKLHDSIQKCLECRTSKKASHIIEWLPYNSRFRYVFSKDLTEKPW
ncbi:Ternary complex factor MIP1, leucine-zipper [Parasponia andersonii]|uniref:Ternary complex factor MIP1, leucine-zipper n=1 Tax=Parasponia andersonii TaxID=3476 RepID=A0A2P5AME7_PARAD|nr:Ternary complex factor MIP1, leucine-zipper [Parasponia andersonii]